MIPISLHRRKLLTCGMLVSGPHGIKILLDEDLSKDETAITLWHEVVHIIRAMNSNGNSDEEEVERDAKRLALAFPEIVDWAGLDFPAATVPPTVGLPV